MINIAIDGPAGAGKSTIARRVAALKDYIYVGAVLKCIVSLPNGNELKIERLAGQELPPIGSRIYPYWEPEDAVLIHNDSYKIFKILDEIKLA